MVFFFGGRSGARRLFFRLRVFFRGRPALSLAKVYLLGLCFFSLGTGGVTQRPSWWRFLRTFFFFAGRQPNMPLFPFAAQRACAVHLLVLRRRPSETWQLPSFPENFFSFEADWRFSPSETEICPPSPSGNWKTELPPEFSTFAA